MQLIQLFALNYYLKLNLKYFNKHLTVNKKITNVFEKSSAMQKYCIHTTNQLNSLQLHIIYIGTAFYRVKIQFIKYSIMFYEQYYYLCPMLLNIVQLNFKQYFSQA